MADIAQGASCLSNICIHALSATHSVHLLSTAEIRGANCHLPRAHGSWPAAYTSCWMCSPWCTLTWYSITVPRLIIVARWRSINREGGNWGLIGALSYQRGVVVPTRSRRSNSAPGRGSPWGCVWRSCCRLSRPWRSCSPAHREACSWGSSVWPCPSDRDPGIWHPLVPAKVVSWGSGRQWLSLRCWCSSSHWWRQSGWGLTWPYWGRIPVPVGACPVRGPRKLASRPLSW